MLKLAITREEHRHFSEAQDIYRQIIEAYPGTKEEQQARERLLDMAHRFGSENQPYRMMSLYGTLEALYAGEKGETTAEARRGRVREILDEIHEKERRQAETIPEGTAP